MVDPRTTTEAEGTPPEREPFAAFYERELTWARRLAFVFLGDADAADDIVQDAFVQLHRRFDGLDAPRAYLWVTIVNSCRRFHRRETGRRRAYGALEQPESVSQPSGEVLDLVDKLPVRQRAVLVLRYFEGLSEVEIAETIGCRPGTVKSLSARALERLRRELGE